MRLRATRLSGRLQLNYTSRQASALIKQFSWRTADGSGQLGRFRRRQLLAQDGKNALSFGKLGVCFLATTSDQNHVFAALLIGVGNNLCRQILQWLAQHGLEHLGQFACQHRFTIASKNIAHIGQTFGHPMG